jgi:hypothetical protein
MDITIGSFNLSTCIYILVCDKSVFCNFFFTHGTPNVTREGTPQNFSLRKGDTKQHVASKNADSINVQP